MKSLQRVSDTVNRTVSYVGIAVFLVLILACVMQVFFRFVLNHSLSWTEELARAVTMACGGSVSVSLFSMEGAFMKKYAVKGIVTRSQVLGSAIRRVKEASDCTPEEAFLRIAQGFRLFKGKICDVLREVRAGFNFGKVLLKMKI